MTEQEKRCSELYVSGLSIEQVAHEMGISRTRTHRMLCRARVKMRKGSKRVLPEGEPARAVAFWESEGWARRYRAVAGDRKLSDWLREVCHEACERAEALEKEGAQ